MKEHVTTALDAIGIILVGIGLGFAAGMVIGLAGVAVAGAVILAGSWLAAKR